MLNFNNTAEQEDYFPNPEGDAVESARDAMAEHGLEPGDIVMDENLHRFDLGKPKDKAGWYVFYPGDICAGAFGDWISGNTSNPSRLQHVRSLHMWDGRNESCRITQI